MADKSYPPQYTNDPLQVFGIESFSDLDAVLLVNNKTKLGMP